MDQACRHAASLLISHFLSVIPKRDSTLGEAEGRGRQIPHSTLDVIREIPRQARDDTLWMAYSDAFALPP